MAAAQCIGGANHQDRTPITHKRAGDGLVSDAASWLHRSDCLPVEGPIGREGSQSAPGSIKDGSSIGTHHGNHEC